MTEKCEVTKSRIYKREKDTILVMNGTFSSVPGNLRIYIEADGVQYSSNAWILPLEQGKGSLPHHFEIERSELPLQIASLSIVLKQEDGKEEVLQQYTQSEIKTLMTNETILSHIESVSFGDNGVGTIIGWAFSLNQTQLSYDVYDSEGNRMPISLRRTMQQRLTDRKVIDRDESFCGFIISFEGSKDRSYRLKLNDTHTASEVLLDSYVFKESMGTAKIIHLLRMMNRHNFQRGMRYLKKNGIAGFVKRLLQGVTDDMDYDGWFRRNHITKEELNDQRSHVFAYQPKISIIVPTFNTPIDLLQEMIHSVLQQTYSNWELCIADGSSPESKTRKEILACREKEERIKVVLLNENYGISGNTNRALELASGEYTGLFDHDDLLEPDALYEIVASLQTIKHDIIYTDEDKLNDQTKRLEDPNFKPDYDKDLFLSHNYITHFFVVKTKIIRDVGGFASQYDGSQDYDVMLKCIEKSESIHHIAKSLYHWRMHEGSTALDPESKMYCYIAGQNAIQAHLDRIGIPAKVEMQRKPLFGLYHVIYQAPNALVSIIIPNMDHTDILKTCINSLLTTNQYANIEIIIVENNSKEQSTFTYYEEIQKQHSYIHVVTWYGKEFNFSAINNYGVTQSHGEYILFLNNDTEMINGDALSEMVGLCSREDIGVVGAKLLYADNTIQHAGVVIGFSGYAGHVFNDIPNGKDYGYMTRDVLNGDLSAVTAACMLTKRSVFDQVNGFDEQFKVSCNDIDYCLKVRETGKLVAYNAFAMWHHYESKSRGYDNQFDKIVRFDQEVAVWQQKWMHVLLAGDPYYNPNFKIEDGPFILQ